MLKSFSTILILILIITQVLSEDNPYKVLGLNKNADDKQIKSAFRKLSQKYHPDKNSDPAAQKYYAKITNAYDILSDKEKRSNYDIYGTTDRQQQQRQQQQDMYNYNFGGRQQQYQSRQQRYYKQQQSFREFESEFDKAYERKYGKKNQNNGNNSGRNNNRQNQKRQQQQQQYYKQQSSIFDYLTGDSIYSGFFLIIGFIMIMKLLNGVMDDQRNQQHQRQD